MKNLQLNPTTAGNVFPPPPLPSSKAPVNVPSITQCDPKLHDYLSPKLISQIDQFIQHQVQVSMQETMKQLQSAQERIQQLEAELSTLKQT